MNKLIVTLGVIGMLAGCGSVVSGEEDNADGTADVGADGTADTAGDVAQDVADVGPGEEGSPEDVAGEDSATDEGTSETEADATDEADVADATDPCEGGWLDETTGLCWEEPSGTEGNWDEANGYCAGRATADGLPWRLPTISELRTLVRGCPSIVAGGSCRVADSCPSMTTCYSATECLICGVDAGPGPAGSYGPDELFVDGVYASVTASTDDSITGFWSISFRNGGIFRLWQTCAPASDCYTFFMCVRFVL